VVRLAHGEREQWLREDREQQLQKQQQCKVQRKQNRQIARERQSNANWLAYTARSLDHAPCTEQFTTSDGRTFALFIDGETMLDTFQKLGISFKRKRAQQLMAVSGLILEVGASEPALVFEWKHKHELERCWAKLHRQFGVQPPDYPAIDSPSAELEDILDVPMIADCQDEDFDDYA